MKNRYFGTQTRENTHSEWFEDGEIILSTGRILWGSFAVLSAVAAFYCSLFYVPAFIDQKGIVRLSSVEKIKPSLETEVVNWYTPYMDLLRLRRGYFKAGQNIQIEYIMAERGDLTIEIVKCAGPVIVEIFQCTVTEKIEHTQTNSIKGEIATTMNQNGFYRLKEVAKNPAGEAIPYSVVWRRL